MNDIRWRQRFDSYRRAFKKLTEIVQLHNDKGLSEIEQEAMIRRFEYTYDLAWKVLKGYLKEFEATELYDQKRYFALPFSGRLLTTVWSGWIWSNNAI